MHRAGGAAIGGVLGALLAGAATQLLFLLCVIGGPDAESCGMSIYLLALPAFVLIGGGGGVVAGFAVESSDRVSQLGRTLGGALLGVFPGIALLLAIAWATGDPSQPADGGMAMDLSERMSTATLDSLHHAARVEEVRNAAAFSLPAMTSLVGAFVGWRARSRPQER